MGREVAGSVPRRAEGGGCRKGRASERSGIQKGACLRRRPLQKTPENGPPQKAAPTTSWMGGIGGFALFGTDRGSLWGENLALKAGLGLTTMWGAD